VFLITPSGSFSVLYTFNLPDGVCPSAKLVKGPDGSLYGTTTGGGTNNSAGTVYRVSGGSVTTVASVADNPSTSVTKGRDGNFYGTGYRSVYEVTPSGSATILGVFINKNDVSPSALAQGNDGNFYGTISGGGANGKGSIFEVLTSPLPIVAGSAFDYSITASNIPKSYGASGLPPGLSVNTSTGLISGTPTMSGTYYLSLTATNDGGAASGTLPVVVLGPAITTPPGNQSATAGQSMTFTVVAAGTGTVTYQWQANGTNIPGANGASYTIPSVAVADSGSYSVIISDSNGTVTSFFTVAVLPAIPALPPWAYVLLPAFILFVAARATRRRRTPSVDQLSR
jgi:uncharacterized repeat protein (TIGR03803 family)